MNDVVTIAGDLRTHLLQTESKAPPSLLVVLCHGYGASGEDLLPLAPELVERAPELASARFAFPAGPLSLGVLDWGDSRAWWPLDWARLSALSSSSAQGRATLRQETPEGLVSARRKLQRCIETLMQGTGLGPDRVVLGGFSQGAMLATDLALHWEHRPAALVALSSVILTETVWRKLAPRRAGLPVLQSHGRQDPILPYVEGEALSALLTEAGLPVDFLPFDGPHTIHPDALDRLAALLVRLLP
jgi:phospholipase/carboxylesterase